MNLETYYSPEVEEALVTLCWHKPELLPKVLRSLAPPVHIMQEHLRFILEALQLSQDQLGAADFATVVQVLREDGRLPACGELQGLDALYSRNYGYESLLDYYIELLKLYASKRTERSPEPVVIFDGGKGTICLNKSKVGETGPDYIGAFLVRGRKYKFLGWTSQDRQSVRCSLYAQ